jgi:hypothetical protein
VGFDEFAFGNRGDVDGGAQFGVIFLETFPTGAVRKKVGGDAHGDNPFSGRWVAGRMDFVGVKFIHRKKLFRSLLTRCQDPRRGDGNSTISLSVRVAGPGGNSHRPTFRLHCRRCALK